MSFYWQQGLQQQQQDTGQPAQQQGQWDYINLGGAPAPQHQWNPNAQQQQNNYYYPPQQNNGTVQPVAQQWVQQQVPQQVPQQAQVAPQVPPQHQTPVKVQHPVIEHKPILHPTQTQQPPVQQTYQAPIPPQQTQQVHNSHNAQYFIPEPPVLAPSAPSAPTFEQPQPAAPQYYQQVYNPPEPALQPVKEQHFQPPPLGSFPPSKEPTPERHVAPVAPTPKVQKVAATPLPLPPKKEVPVAAPAVVEPKVKVTPTSSEDDWEKADMEVQRVEDENKRQISNPAPGAQKPVEKQPESRESSSLGGSWSQQDTEPSERSSVEPVEILEHAVIVEEEKTPRVSMSDNTEHTPTPAITTIAKEERQETPDAVVRHADTSLANSSPGSAMATSTPKDFEKRPSISSQGTIDAEKQKKKDNFKKPILVEKEESGNNSDSTMASGRPDFERGHARASYREYKKTYMEICDRLKMFRHDQHTDFRPSSKLANPLLAAAGVSLSRHPAIRRDSTSSRNDGRASVPLQLSQSHSFTDGASNGGRRSRVSRLDPRPSSRQSGNYTYDSRAMYDHRYAQQQNPHYRQGRYSAMGLPYRGYEGGYDPRRPHSSYQEPYQEQLETSSYSGSEDGDDNGESDEEIRQYNTSQQPPMKVYGVRVHPQQQNVKNSTMYYCGVVHVNIASWRRIEQKYGIPEEFHSLQPIEMAAFMFYTVVFGQPYKDVDAFHKRFMREFYKYRCEDTSEDDALFKICRSMQEQHLERQKQRKLEEKRVNATLFSDDTSIDGQSEINSVYDESNAGDVHDYGPRKFLCPHSFMHISTGGQVISINTEKSISAVEFEDIKGLLRDIPTLQVKEAAQAFKGPLLPNQSAPHTVRLYITKQIENIKRSDVARENPEENDVVESLLVWQLLETMVKQQGNITGPDIAELLAKVANEPVNIEAPPQASNITPALNQFTQFLLGGHVDEAVESAMRNGLFADALVLTRRLFPNDEKRIEQIESRFLQTRSLNNPVTTLVSVAKGEAPPVLTNPPMDDHLSWRTHAAIILANLDQQGTAMKTIYSLGRALAKRDYHCAADFCFLVCCVLGGDNPFIPQHAAEGEEEYRRHISLVNSDIPDNEANPKCKYGFLISDLHATEIFDYALRLKPGRVSPLATSVEYQTARIKYAKLLANHGFNADAYRYCTAIASDIWNATYLFKPEDLMELVDLADSLHFAACAGPDDTVWIGHLRTAVSGMMGQHVPVEPQAEVASHYQAEYQQDAHNDFSVEPLQPTPAPAPVQHHVPAPIAVPEPIQEASYVPPTPAESVHNEPFVYPQQHQPPIDLQRSQPPPQQPSYDDIDGFTTSPDYNDSPLTMASSVPPVPEVAATPAVMPPTPVHVPAAPPTQPIPSDPPVAPPTAPPTAAQVDPPHEPLQKSPSGSSWMRNLLNKAATQENPMILPADTNPTIKWDPSQNKYVGEGVEQEVQAPPPPMAVPSAPMAPVASAPMQGGGLRAVRGANRYARTGLSATPSDAAAPAGMIPVAPPTVSFGFMPAPVDDDSEVFDPFSGQANATIQQSGKPLPSDE